VTVADSDCLDPISQITGGRRYSFNVDGQLNLVTHCHAREGRHDFVFGSTVAGPNVFVNSRAERVHADAGPHHRWSSGGLFDNIVTDGELNARNRGNSGTGHGWSGANMVVWNSGAAGYIVESPATAQNWVIGSIGQLRPNTMAVGRVYPPILDSLGCPVEPQSLYTTQLEERIAHGGTQAREYWLGDIDGFVNDGNSDQPFVDLAWLDALAKAGLPLIGFDDLTPGAWVPFTVLFNLQPGEVVVGAQLTLALKASGPAIDGGAIYLGNLDGASSYLDLGWLPLADGQTSVRVFDLSSQLDLVQSGQLDVALGPDTAVDWAMLRVRTTGR
jgi:hypothetical protein